MTDKTEILPCPFCGKAPKARWLSASDAGDDGYFGIDCCHAFSHGDNEADAIAAWNTRAPGAVADATDEEIAQWVERHGLDGMSRTDARAAFEDAATAHMLAAAPAPAESKPAEFVSVPPAPHSAAQMSPTQQFSAKPAEPAPLPRPAITYLFAPDPLPAKPAEPVVDEAELLRLRAIEHYCWHLMDAAEDDGKLLTIDTTISKREIDALNKLLPESHPPITAEESEAALRGEGE